MALLALTWNLFHGRDFPPDPALRTWRSRLWRREERGASHVQVNRDLLEEFATVLSGAAWDVALLQECPPRWAEPLAAACDAEPHRVLTSRNSLGWARAAAARLNPDLIASNEGGSNLTLVRTPGPSHRTPGPSHRTPPLRCEKWTEEVQNSHRKRGLAVHDGPLERRAMALTSVWGGLCVANLHASSGDAGLAAADVLRAAEAASTWAAGRPLLFGGDLNLRPAESPAVFDELRERFGLDGATGPHSIDHLLVAGMETIDPPRPWPPRRRELAYRGLALRLSDHSPVQGEFSSYGSNTVMA